MSGLSPKVSVIISTYNRAQYLGRAIQSVLSQSFEDFELIVVDDASKDTTKDVVAQFNDSRIRYIRHEENRGGPAARNTGIKNTSGVFLAFLDDDDQWCQEKLQKQVRKMESLSTRVGLVYAGSEIYNEQKKRIDCVNVPAYSGNVYKRLLLSTILGSVSSVLVRRECFTKVGMFD
ncbi:MAG: glycosyltransferase family 2 protein, partial [Candidatus Omnitrophica bacterium]|nr:glycosyltransferase family 2 protein [Candidatus Omnitrophota bacterium]